MRRPAPRPLGQALAEVSAGLAPATTLARVQARWGDAVGDVIAEEAEPVSEREGVVTVACRSAVWAQELDLLGRPRGPPERAPRGVPRAVRSAG